MPVGNMPRLGGTLSQQIGYFPVSATAHILVIGAQSLCPNTRLLLGEQGETLHTHSFHQNGIFCVDVFTCHVLIQRIPTENPQEAGTTRGAGYHQEESAWRCLHLVEAGPSRYQGTEIYFLEVISRLGWRTPGLCGRDCYCLLVTVSCCLITV